MTTESRIDIANREMAAIPDDAAAVDKRERLRAIWQPIAHALIDNAHSGWRDARRSSDPNFVGLTCDTRRPVFLEKKTSASGFVYRKFMVDDSRAT